MRPLAALPLLALLAACASAPTAIDQRVIAGAVAQSTADSLGTQAARTATQAPVNNTATAARETWTAVAIAYTQAVAETAAAVYAVQVAATVRALTPSATLTPTPVPTATRTPTPNAQQTQQAQDVAQTYYYAQIYGVPAIVITIIICIIAVSAVIGGAKANAIEGEARARKIEAEGKADAARTEAAARADAIREEGQANAFVKGMRSVPAGSAVVSHTTRQFIATETHTTVTPTAPVELLDVPPVQRLTAPAPEHAPDVQAAISIIQEAIRLNKREGGARVSTLPPAETFSDHTLRAAVFKALVEAGELQPGGGRGNRTRTTRASLGHLLEALEADEISLTLPHPEPEAAA